jgi:hypothetical protein
VVLVGRIDSAGPSICTRTNFKALPARDPKPPPATPTASHISTTVPWPERPGTARSDGGVVEVGLGVKVEAERLEVRLGGRGE